MHKQSLVLRVACWLHVPWLFFYTIIIIIMIIIMC